MTPTDQPSDKSRVDQLDHLENLENGDLPKAIVKAIASGDAVQMRSTLDDLPTFKAVRIYWRISVICMLGAFSAALEGYRAFIIR